MTTWADDVKADQLQEQARGDAARRVLTAVIAWARAAWPQVVRAGTWVTEAIAAVFVAIGWILGFVVFCLRGVVYGFCSGAGIPQPAELIARRREARKQEKPPPVSNPGVKPLCTGRSPTKRTSGIAEARASTVRTCQPGMIRSRLSGRTGRQRARLCTGRLSRCP